MIACTAAARPHRGPVPGRSTLLHLLALLAACVNTAPVPDDAAADASAPFVVVLGTAQDAGLPQAGCDRTCCRPAREDPLHRRRVASLALVDPGTGRRWIIDATPDFREQLHHLGTISAAAGPPPALSGIFLTHAHIGHYTGLIQLGREVMDARSVPVHAMPRMERFLRTSGPWSQLVELGNIRLVPLRAERPVTLGPSLRVTALPVPHRDELSEAVGFRLDGPRRSVLYVPDIDKWEHWDTPLAEILATVDRAYLDGTFFADGEIPGRDMAEIPHPFIVETLALLAALPAEERAKVRFIHLNHTNPAHAADGEAAATIRAAGLAVAHEGERFAL